MLSCWSTTPAMRAAEHKPREALGLLLEHNASVSVCDEHGDAVAEADEEEEVDEEPHEPGDEAVEFHAHALGDGVAAAYACGYNTC